MSSTQRQEAWTLLVCSSHLTSCITYYIWKVWPVCFKEILNTFPWLLSLLNLYKKYYISSFFGKATWQLYFIAYQLEGGWFDILSVNYNLNSYFLKKYIIAAADAKQSCQVFWCFINSFLISVANIFWKVFYTVSNAAYCLPYLQIRFDGLLLNQI